MKFVTFLFESLTLIVTFYCFIERTLAAFFFWSPPLCNDVLFLFFSTKHSKTNDIALKMYKSLNIFRTNDKIVIACYSYNMDIFSSL